MTEIWKPIPGYEGLYEISDIGRVKSLPRETFGLLRFKEERIISSNGDGKGYRTIKLSKNGKVSRYLVHRLVAMAFIPNPDNLPYINHKDENRSNNNVGNLEWCTPKYNVNYGNAHSKWKESYLKSNGRPICSYDENGNLVKEYNCFVDAVREGYKRRHIEECINGLKRMHKGLFWANKGEKPIIRNPIAGKPIAVIGFPVNGGDPILYNSMISAEKDGFHGQNISHCIRGKQHTHMGYKWYKQDEQLNIETL